MVRRRLNMPKRRMTSWERKRARREEEGGETEGGGQKQKCESEEARLNAVCAEAKRRSADARERFRLFQDAVPGDTALIAEYSRAKAAMKAFHEAKQVDVSATSGAATASVESSAVWTCNVCNVTIVVRADGRAREQHLAGKTHIAKLASTVAPLVLPAVAAPRASASKLCHVAAPKASQSPRAVQAGPRPSRAAPTPTANDGITSNAPLPTSVQPRNTGQEDAREQVTCEQATSGTVVGPDGQLRWTCAVCDLTIMVREDGRAQEQHLAGKAHAKKLRIKGLLGLAQAPAGPRV